VLVVVAAGAVLLTMVATGASRVRARGRGVSCLANLQRIGAATITYSLDDPRNQAVPMHRMMVSTHGADGFTDALWLTRTVLPSSFGGRTATAPMPTEDGDITVMTDPAGYWGAKTKPLNRYLAGPASVGLETFHCPADTGYVEDWGYVGPAEAANIPYFDFLGNSYTMTTAGMQWITGEPGPGYFAPQAFFRVTPAGHTAESIESPLSETILYCDPFFRQYTMRLASNPDIQPLPGWHGELMADNVAYCDGSARRTQIGELRQFTDEELEAMGVTQVFPWYVFLRRGPDWQMDCYPTPGALIRVYDDNGLPLMPQDPVAYYEGWPLDDHQVNEAP
jgi:hypothetical protein